MRFLKSPCGLFFLLLALACGAEPRLERFVERLGQLWGAVQRVYYGQIHDAGLELYSGSSSIRRPGKSAVPEPVQLRRK